MCLVIEDIMDNKTMRTITFTVVTETKGTTVKAEEILGMLIPIAIGEVPDYQEFTDHQKATEFITGAMMGFRPTKFVDKDIPLTKPQMFKQVTKVQMAAAKINKVIYENRGDAFKILKCQITDVK